LSILSRTAKLLLIGSRCCIIYIDFNKSFTYKFE
jgi:hypothetical protein